MANDRVALLSRVPLFQGLERRELEAIATTLKPRTFRPGDTVVEEGAGGVGFFIIEDGEARVTVHGEDRGRLGPGDYFGEIALLRGSDRTATITAEGDLRCLAMTSWEFRPLVEDTPSIAWKLLQTMARRLGSAEDRTP